MKLSDEKRLETRQRHFIMGIAIMVLLCIVVSVAQFHTVARQPRPKIGLVMRGAKDDDGWNKVQYEGLRAAARDLGMAVIVKENALRSLGDYRKILDSLASQGVQRVVITWHRYPPELREILRQYPNMEFILQTTEFSEENMVSCSTRLFEVQYLAGLIAGYQTETGVVGYVAPFPCVEVNRGLNAFTIGVKRANPEAHVKVAWSSEWNTPEREKAAVDALAMEDVDVLSYQQDGRTVADAAEKKGIDYIDAHEPHPEHRHCLTAVQSDWRAVYRNLLSRHVRTGRMANANNYLWQGFLEHIVALAPLSEGVKAKARWEIARSVRHRSKGERLIYGGEIYDNNGVKRCDEKEILSNEYLRVHMNWLVKGVEQVE